MRPWPSGLPGIIACAATLILLGCSTGARPVHEIAAVTASDGVQHVHVTAHSFWFEPNRIVVKKGVPVELSFTNGGLLVPHNLSCVSPDAGVSVSENVGTFGRHKHARFTPTETGEFPFFCKVDGHSKKGMTGTIVVKE